MVSERLKKALFLFLVIVIHPYTICAKSAFLLGRRRRRCFVSFRFCLSVMDVICHRRLHFIFCFNFSPYSLSVSQAQCDQVGLDFLKFFYQKQPKCLVTFWAFLKKVKFLSKKCCNYFWGNFGKNWATFYSSI